MPLVSSVTLYYKVYGFIHQMSLTYTEHCVSYCVTTEHCKAFMVHTSYKPGFLLLLLQTTLTPAGELLSTSESTPLRLYCQHFSTKQWTDSIYCLIMPCICCIVWLLEENPQFLRKDLTSHKLSEKMWCSCCNDLPFL